MRGTGNPREARRPSVSEIKPDWLSVKILAKIGLGRLGDDGLLRNLGKALEEECGVRLVGAADVFTDLLAPLGLLTTAVPDAQAKKDMERAMEVAETLGRLDVGQAVIAQQGLVLGVEAIEGTDALITRAATFKREGWGGVLVKLAKAQQDNRFDLPTIGPDTITAMERAGFSGIAIEAGRSLLLERDKTIAMANVTRLFILGFKRGEFDV